MIGIKVEKAHGEYDPGTSKFFGAPTMPEEWLSDGTIGVIGTDAHNLSSRPPMYKKAEDVIRKKCGEKSFERICRISEEILFG